jgi:hypothetical protein
VKSRAIQPTNSRCTLAGRTQSGRLGIVEEGQRDADLPPGRRPSVAPHAGLDVIRNQLKLRLGCPSDLAAVCDTAAMTGRVVLFRHADGHTLDVAVSDLERIYGELLRLPLEPGAASTAALLLYEARKADPSRTTVDLNGQQTKAVRRAVEQIHAHH